MTLLPILLVVGGREYVVDNWVHVSAAVITAVAAIIALFLSRKSLKRAEQASYADVLLRLEQEMREHRDIHSKLRPGGEWSGERKGPCSANEWVGVDAYMGLFERINFLIDEEVLKTDYVRRFYGYRYDNIIRHPLIYQEKLVDEHDLWEDFIKLGEKLGRHPSRIVEVYD